MKFQRRRCRWGNLGCLSIALLLQSFTSGGRLSPSGGRSCSWGVKQPLGPTNLYLGVQTRALTLHEIPFGPCPALLQISDTAQHIMLVSLRNRSKHGIRLRLAGSCGCAELRPQRASWQTRRLDLVNQTDVLGKIPGKSGTQAAFQDSKLSGLTSCRP